MLATSYQSLTFISVLFSVVLQVQAGTKSIGCYEFIVGNDSTSTTITHDFNNDTVMQEFHQGADAFLCLAICQNTGNKPASEEVGITAFEIRGENTPVTRDYLGARCYCQPKFDLSALTSSAACSSVCYKWEYSSSISHRTSIKLRMKCGSLTQENIMSVYTFDSAGNITEQQCETLEEPGAKTLTSFMYAQINYRMSPLSCASLCYYSIGAKYAAISGYFCFCSMAFDSKNLTFVSDCDEKCAGDVDEFCGNFDNGSASVYEFELGKTFSKDDKVTPASVNSSCINLGKRVRKENLDAYRQGWNMWAWPHNRETCWQQECRSAVDVSGNEIFHYAGLMAGKGSSALHSKALCCRIVSSLFDDL